MWRARRNSFFILDHVLVELSLIIWNPLNSQSLMHFSIVCCKPKTIHNFSILRLPYDLFENYKKGMEDTTFILEFSSMSGILTKISWFFFNFWDFHIIFKRSRNPGIPKNRTVIDSGYKYFKIFSNVLYHIILMGYSLSPIPNWKYAL